MLSKSSFNSTFYMDNIKSQFLDDFDHGAAAPKSDTTRYTNFEVNAKCFAHTPFSSPHHTNEATNKNQH